MMTLNARRVMMIITMIIMGVICGIYAGVIAGNGNIAYAESSTISGGGSGGGGGNRVFQYRKVTGSNNDIIKRLNAQKGGSFRCKNNIGWALWDTTTNKWAVDESGINNGYSSTVKGSWKDGILYGGENSLWNTYINDKQTSPKPTTSGTDTGWRAGCVMISANKYYQKKTTTIYKYDVSAQTELSAQDIKTCYINYDNTIIGLDGYVKGKSYTKEDTPVNGVLSSDGNSVITPYGQLYNNLLSKKGDYAQYSNDVGSASALTTLRNKLIELANDACSSTSKTKTSVTLSESSDTTKAFAKGGIIEVSKRGTRQTLTYPSSSTTRSNRKVKITTTQYIRCAEKSNVCNIGVSANKTQPSTQPSTTTSYVYDKNGMVWKSGVTGIKSKDIKRYYCNQKTQTDSSTYSNGCWSSKTGKTSVGFKNNSQIQIFHYDILNILCDKKDFELYKSWAKSSSGFSNVDDSVSTSSSRRYQATLVSSKSNDSNATFQQVSKTLFSMNKLSGWSNTSSSDKKKMTALLTSYNAANDPVYTKECPFDCTASTTGSAASANGASSNVGKTNASSSTRSGVKVNASDGTGSMSASSSNSADMTFFRDNTWNNLTTDVWYPSTKESISYTGSKAKRTIISRWADGTPKGTNGAELQAKQGSSWSDVFTSSTGGSIGSQTSPATASNGVYSSGLISVLNGQVNSFRIRAPWASTANKPLKYSIKWEYDVSNTVPVITGMSSTGDDGSASTVMETTTATSDGKCSAYYDGSSSRNGDTDSVSTNTGSGTTYTLANFDNDDISRVFTILFVRSTTD